MLNGELKEILKAFEDNKKIVFIDNFGEKHDINSVKISKDNETIKICEY